MPETGFTVQDRLAGRAGEVDTSVSSAASNAKVVQGPEIGMKETEGQQISNALSRFAPAGSKLLKEATEAYKDEQHKKGQVMFELGQELPNDAGQFLSEGYNATRSLNLHYDASDKFEEWSKSHPQASPVEAKSKWVELYGTTRAEIAGLDKRSLDIYDTANAKASRGYLKQHLERNIKYNDEQASTALGRTLMGASKEYLGAAPGSEEEQSAESTFAQLLMTVPDNPVGDVQNRKLRMKAIEDVLSTSVLNGSDKLLKIAEGIGPLTHDPDMAEKLTKLRKAYNTEQDKVVTGEKVAMEGVLRDMIAKGATPEDAVAFSNKHSLHITSEHYWSIRDKAEKDNAKLALAEAHAQAAGNGSLMGLGLSAEDNQKAVTAWGDRIVSSYPDKAQGELARMAWLIKWGYEDNTLKRQMEAVSSMVVPADGSTPPQLDAALKVWKSAKTWAAEGQNLSRQFGDPASAFFRDVEFLSGHQNISIGAAAKEIQRLRSDKTNMERQEREVEKEVPNRASSWWSSKNISSPGDIAKITEHAKMLVRTGMATTTEGAVETSVEAFRREHTLVNGRWMPMKQEELDQRVRNGSTTGVTGLDAFKTYFNLPQVRKSLGLEQTKFENLSFVPTADKQGVTVYKVDEKGVAYPIPGVHSFAEIGKPSVNAALVTRAQNVQNGDRTNKDYVALEANVRRLLMDEYQPDDPRGYPVYASKRMDSLSVKDIGYNLAQWNSLDDNTKRTEVNRLAMYAAAKANGQDTTPYATPARVFKFKEAPTVVPHEKVIQGLVNAENGGDTKSFVRSRDTSNGPSSAYGPMQVTMTLAKDSLNNLTYLFNDKERQFLGRYISHGKQMLDNTNNPLTPQFQPGGPGALAPEDKAMYFPVFTKVVKHYMNKYDNNLVRVASVWRYGEGKGSKTDAPAGYLMNFFKNIN